MKILVVVDGRPSAFDALSAAAAITARLGAELGVLVVRSGTLATEDPPPVGVDIPTGERGQLPAGIQILLGAAEQLGQAGLLVPPASVKLQDVPQGYLFAAAQPTGARVMFCERFGNFIDEVNHEVDANDYDLLVMASPRRGALGRFASMNLPRRLALDLSCAFLIVRGGSLDSRFVVCTDGSPSSLRIFPLLQKLMPAVKGPVDLIYARRPDDPKAESDKAQHCLNQAYQWLTRCGKQVRVLQPEGNKRFELILAAAGCDSVIVMGESHMHDIRRRTLGTLGIKVLSRTDSSFLMVKLANEPSPFACAAHHDDGLLP